MQIQKLPLPQLNYPLFPSLHPYKISCNLNLNLNPKSQSGYRKIGGLVVVKANLEGEAKTDEFYMRRCVELARTAIGCTSPNPMVGCLIVKDGQIVGQGFHPKAGQPHAEVFALRDAGDLAENATAYVSLEPCNHYGRTPPCTEALIKAKVKKVVVGMVDPNPIVASKGVDRLRDSGIEVLVGIEEELCKRLNEAYIHQMLTGKPFVTLRYTLSINGHVLNQLGERAMECGGYYSKLLQEYDAVITSVSLAEKHSVPASQEPGAYQPLSIIVAKGGKGPGFSIKIPSLTEESASKVVIFTDKETTVQLEIVQKGVETVVLERMNFGAILEFCRRRGLCSILLDLRGHFVDFEELLVDGIEQNIFQKILVEMLPLWDECDDGSSLLALNGIEKRMKVKNLQPRNLNQSIILEGYLYV